MATFLDLGLFQYFNVIFPILLIFAVLFAILHKTQILGKNPTINAIIAVSVALMSLLSRTLIDLINFMAPWFVLAFIFLILLLLMYQLMGATEKDFAGVIRSDKTVQWAIVGVGLLIILASFGHVFGQKLLPVTQPDNETVVSDGGSVASSDYGQNVYATLFNPKVLGLIFIFLIAIFAVAFLSGG